MLGEKSRSLPFTVSTIQLCDFTYKDKLYVVRLLKIVPQQFTNCLKERGVYQQQQPVPVSRNPRSL